MVSSLHSPTVQLPLAKHWPKKIEIKNTDPGRKPAFLLIWWSRKWVLDAPISASFVFFFTHPTPILRWFCSFFGLSVTIFSQFSPHSFSPGRWTWISPPSLMVKTRNPRTNAASCPNTPPTSCAHGSSSISWWAPQPPKHPERWGKKGQKVQKFSNPGVGLSEFLFGVAKWFVFWEYFGNDPCHCRWEKNISLRQEEAHKSRRGLLWFYFFFFFEDG